MPATIDRRRYGTGANVRAALVVFVVALVVMAIFLSASLQSHVYDLPESPVTEPLVVAVEQWHEWMERIGAAGVSDAVATELQLWHDAQFEE